MSKPITNENITKIVAKKSIIIFFKIMLAVVMALFYIITMVFMISPISAAKMFNFFNMNKAVESCYVTQYDRTGSNADLYNLIVFEAEMQDYSKERYYINMLTSSSEYEDFCSRVDTAAIKSEDNLSLIPYVANLDGYLKNQMVKCLYNLNLNVAGYVHSSLLDDSINYAFATYVDLINSNKLLSKEKKIEMYQELLSTFSESETREVSELYQSKMAKLAILKAQVQEDKDANKLAIILHAAVNMYRARYVVENTINESGASVYKVLYENALLEYETLIESAS